MRVLDGSGILYIHTLLYRHFGDPGWWPGDTPFEVAVGAVLTQNTSWVNVERAIGRMKDMGILDPLSVLEHREDIPYLIRSAGYYNQKSGYLIGLCEYLVEGYGGDISRMSEKGTERLRWDLLDLKGIGRETADSILCYSLNRPVFVVDSYTKRVFERLDRDEYAEISEGPGAEYDRIKDHVEISLKGDNLLYNRLHALIVYLGKGICRPKPLCGSCPLNTSCGSYLHADDR
ncbi:MAG: endonuclease III domain-containing protein [Thermoplasmatota archaeon]